MIHYFNPGHETAVLNASPYYMPPAIQLKMREDLAYLPAWYGSAEDYILVEKSLNTDFQNSIKSLGSMPKAITKEDFTSKKEDLSNSNICLWGISPGSIHIFETINLKYALELKIPLWYNEYATLCSRITAKKCLEYIISYNPEIFKSIIPRFYTHIEQIEQVVGQSDSQLLAKAPYSSSGRGLLWLQPGQIPQSFRQIIHGILKKQAEISIEKVLDKKLDFAMEFFADGRGNISYEGYSLFQTDNKGNYIGNDALAKEKIEKRIHSFISPTLLENVKFHLIEFLAANFAPVYKGCIGVDMLIYEKNGKFELHPCVEINMRYNMGFLTLKLFENYIDNDSEGYFVVNYDPKPEIIQSKHEEMQQLYPAVFENNKLKHGYLALCPVTDENNYHAYVIIK